AEVKHRLSVGDPNACRFSNLWGKLQDLTSESSSPPHPQRPKVLRFLALEGGLVNTGAATRFFIGDTQDEIHREHAPLTTFDLNKLRARVASEHGLEAAQLRVDDADFTDEYRIRSLLANERLFRVR
ncbi:MAG: hypothetical protein KDD55_13760, partial [Bdellovibrionales bacterium]|nr:hypothetical protein [Bdellovibrionales bacterium]